MVAFLARFSCVSLPLAAAAAMLTHSKLRVTVGSHNLEIMMADMLLVNGKVRTCDPEGPSAAAVAIRDGRIVAVGDIATARSALPGAAEVDLGGATVIPGLIDPHNHMLATGQMLGEMSLYDVRSIGELQDRVRDAIDGVPAGTWITGRGWDETLLAEGRMPTRHDLDAVAPDHPVMLQRVWNKLVVNSCALRTIGIDASTPDPRSDVNYAGGFDREPDGHPTGIFRDRAKSLVLDGMPHPSGDDLVEALGRACRAYNAVGITTIVDPGLQPEQIDAYHRAAEQDVLTVRSDLLMAAWGFVPAADEPVLEARISGMRDLRAKDSALARLAGVKLLPDGGVGDRTARLLEPYEGEPDNYGVWAIPEAELPDRIRWVHDQGWAMDIHTCGDAAQQVSVRAFAEAQEANSNPDLRHRVHHAYLPTPDTLERMARHRIPAVISTPFIRSLGESFVQSLGPVRADQMMPFRTYLDHGVPLAGSSDSTVADFNPWVGMATAMTRETVTGRVLGADQVLTATEALALYTSGAAFAMGRESDLGRIANGLRADLVVIGADPFGGDVSPEEMMDTKPVGVMLDGQWVFGG
jgi:predicted amidohydrolase YtcJ